MEILDLYRFINENDVEYRWINDEDVCLFVNNFFIERFHAILDGSIFDDDGISCIMKDGYFCFHMRFICEYHGIELEEIFKKED